MAKTWADRQIERGVRLELSQHKARGCWKKWKDGKHHYLNHPITKHGYEAALLQWSQIVARLDAERPNAEVYHQHREMFSLVLGWLDHFGVPDGEKPLAKQVEQFLQWLDDLMGMPSLLHDLPVDSFILKHHPREFVDEFIKSQPVVVGGPTWRITRLPAKWQERIRQLDESPKSQKRPQTTEYWLDRYIERAVARSKSTTKISTAKDRKQRIGKFREFADTSKHVSTIKADTMEEYHSWLDQQSLARKSKVGYFNAFRMFVRWASKQEDCDLTAPANLDDREFGFREAGGTGRKRMAKRQQFWEPEDFQLVVKNVPQPYKCFCLLMLNCGFRATDLSSLRHDDVDLEDGRIVIQREKLNNIDSAPVVNYSLWPITVELLQEAKSDDATYVFRNRKGGSLVVQRHLDNGDITVYDLLSTYWFRNREKLGISKRLDFIRKTGSTEIERFNRGIETVYLGEALSTTARIHYSFNDGEPLPDLDDAIEHLGVKFGLVKSTKKRNLKLSGDLVASLEVKAQAKGMTVEQLLSQL